MEFWPGNQGQLPLYSKFGTFPGRHCTHNYHDRHQATHYPLYYGEQQDQNRESSYWTVPGSRTGGAPQEYSNWTEQELTHPTSSHFSFAEDRHSQQLQELGEFQPHEARDREWTAAQRAAREYERGFLREGWQRWEHCSPVRLNREASTKRNDSSYRELEAWAARYSHSLPRRRRIEAELRGTSQGLLESNRATERDSRAGTDPRVAALQQVIQSANIRESGQWDRASRQRAPNYHPSQTPSTDTSHMLDMKETTSYQRRMFSQPPGYIAPPPYNSPRKSSPVLPQCDTSWEQEVKRQTYWSQPPLRKQDSSVALQEQIKEDQEYFTKPDGNQCNFQELEGLKHLRQETALQTSIPIGIKNAHIQHEDMALQWPQVLQAVQNKTVNKEPSSKVIEGRKFRLNKKTGGMTIFCLVSRIAGTTETPSLPCCTLQTNIQNTEFGGVSKGLMDSGNICQTVKLADEVDFIAPTPTEQSNTSDARNVKAQQEETLICLESDMIEDTISYKAEIEVVSPEKANTNDTNSMFGIQVSQSVQPVSVKYPLWREPSFTSRSETESPSTCLKVNSEEDESDVLHNQEDSAKVLPADIEVRRLDIAKDTKSEDSKGLLVIDTTCVVVKMELIPSPMKAHVHYLDPIPPTEDSQCDIQSTVSPDSISQLNLDVTTDQNTEKNPLHISTRPESEPDSDIMEEETPQGESDIYFPCISTNSVYERETLEDRAERILGIPLRDCITEHKPEDPTSLIDSILQEQEVKPLSIEEIYIDKADEQNPEDTTEEEHSQNQLEVDQTEDAIPLQKNDDAKDQVANEDGEVFVSATQESNMSEENDIHSQLEAEIKASLSSSDLKSLLNISESPKDEGLDPELNSTENLAPYPETCSLPHTPSNQLQSLSPLGSTDFSTSSTSYTNQSHSSCSPLVKIDQTADAVCIGIKDQDEGGKTSQLFNNEIRDARGDLAKDMTEVLVSLQQFKSEQSDENACVKVSIVTNEQIKKEDNKEPTDHIMEETLTISQENATEVNISQQRLECVTSADVACEIESCMTEEQLPKEVNEDPTDHILEQTITQENVTDFQTSKEVNILQERFDNGPEEVASCLKKSSITEEQSQKGAYEEHMVTLELTTSIENATDHYIQIGVNTLQGIKPQTEPSKSCLPSLSESNCEFSRSPLDVLSLSKLSSQPDETHMSDPVCPSSLNPDSDPASGIPETVPAPFHVDPCEGPLQFSSSSDSAPVLLSSFSISPLQDRSESVSHDFDLKEEPQYPKSLWDAVNRIRKHTAPDSENEEEEVSELWDPESVGDDLGRTDVMEQMKSNKITFYEAGQQEVSTELGVEFVGAEQIQPRSHAEDDTLSCSSTSSHGSGDTIIVADEDEVVGMPLDSETGIETEGDEKLKTEEEQCCSGKVNDETAAKEEEDDGDESITNKSSQSEEWLAEVGNITSKPGEMTETELKENK